MRFHTVRYTVAYCVKNNIAIHCDSPEEFVLAGQVFEKNGIPFGSKDGRIKMSADRYPKEKHPNVCISTASRGDRTFGYADASFYSSIGFKIIEGQSFVRDNNILLFSRDNKKRIKIGAK